MKRFLCRDPDANVDSDYETSGMIHHSWQSSSSNNNSSTLALVTVVSTCGNSGICGGAGSSSSVNRGNSSDNSRSSRTSIWNSDSRSNDDCCGNICGADWRRGDNNVCQSSFKSGSIQSRDASDFQVSTSSRFCSLQSETRDSPTFATTARLPFKIVARLSQEITYEGFSQVQAPIKEFTDLNLGSHLTHFFSGLVPTFIQRYSIPILLNRRDLLLCASTGSGKTYAYLIPIICFILEVGHAPSIQAPRGLVLAPTRELASNIHYELIKILAHTGLHAACIYGGASHQVQIASFSPRLDILVATPVRLCDFLERKVLSLNCVSFLVIDEADRVLDSGFEPHVVAVLEACTYRSRQTCLCTVTVSKGILDFILRTRCLVNYEIFDAQEAACLCKEFGYEISHVIQ